MSRLCTAADAEVKWFHTRRLVVPYPYVWLDPTFVHGGPGGDVLLLAVVMAIGVTTAGAAEALGVRSGARERCDHGPQPDLYAAPERVTYGQSFPIPMPAPEDIAQVCFTRLSAVTHAFNTEQRYVPLDFVVTGPEELQITAPTDPNLAPPGHYLLFITNSAGVPATAPIVQLVAT